MSDIVPKPRVRLSKAARRQQLLEVATSIIETEGADALTLASVAARAGVSKPVAYDHFKTRTGLLLALLAQTDSLYAAMAREKITAAPKTLEAVADIVADAYVACALEAGPAASALVAAIQANGQANEIALASRDKHVGHFIQAFGPLLSEETHQLRLSFIALVAAANALCAELTSGRLAKATAVEELSRLLVSVLKPYTH